MKLPLNSSRHPSSISYIENGRRLVLPQLPKRQVLVQSWYCLSKLRGTRHKPTYQANAGQHSDPTQSVSQSQTHTHAHTHKHADCSPPRELLFHQNRRQRSHIWASNGSHSRSVFTDDFDDFVETFLLPFLMGCWFLWGWFW
jgi:hypothetical protein